MWLLFTAKLHSVLSLHLLFNFLYCWVACSVAVVQNYFLVSVIFYDSTTNLSPHSTYRLKKSHLNSSHIRRSFFFFLGDTISFVFLIQFRLVVFHGFWTTVILGFLLTVILDISFPALFFFFLFLLWFSPLMLDLFSTVPLGLSI